MDDTLSVLANFGYGIPQGKVICPWFFFCISMIYHKRQILKIVFLLIEIKTNNYQNDLQKDLDYLQVWHQIGVSDSTSINNKYNIFFNEMRDHIQNMISNHPNWQYMSFPFSSKSFQCGNSKLSFLMKKN